ncbi:MAG: 5-deoxy-glucuronate isomerase [Pseudomonadota bacterium]
MSDLLVKPAGSTGKLHDISVERARTPLSPDWAYVGFSCYRLSPGETAEEKTGDWEVILVVVEGRARVRAAGRDWGELGARMSAFEQTPPHCLYLPSGHDWTAEATTDCLIAMCSAPDLGGYDAARIGPDGIVTTPRGKGTNTRYINAIAMEERQVASSLLVTEVFTPAGHWSSYPPHRHDEDDFPRMTYLEETYYHRLNPANGYGHQRVFTDDLSLDETLSVYDHDVVLVPRGHHPCAAPYGVEMYYLNVMAGPRRNWRFENHPDFDWIAKQDA